MKEATGYRLRALVRVGLAAGVGLLALVILPSASSAFKLTVPPNNVISGKPGNAIHGRGNVSSSYGWSSSNWSGYILTSTSAPFTAVTSNWAVPAIQGGRHNDATYSAAWTGIDGNSSSNPALIQTGTEQDDQFGVAVYRAWWATSEGGYLEQIIRDGCTGRGICGNVVPGDQMSASISETSNNLWDISLSDNTQDWSYSTTVSHSASGESAEWIIEAPSSLSGALPLANYGSTQFDLATVNGASPSLVASDGGDMVQSGRVVSSPSGPDGDLSPDGFATAYGGTPPPAPES